MHWADRPGYRAWLHAAYNAHRRRCLANPYFAEAVVAFESDPQLVAKATAAVEEHRREFEATYGHLRADA
jgi:hypothetical protein